ncbi:hypothetical protein LMG26411_03587 [Cupriavidus numazuensis]|uniref:Uncharacterized protein n=1 Tax=Cupriavidus numazuensis TaxID=221992 RepID=A0ABN7Q1V4_9BURK|nr:hypothetical protein LMG26411_03587 [Cupriavidus numazuensis]
MPTWKAIGLRLYKGEHTEVWVACWDASQFLQHGKNLIRAINEGGLTVDHREKKLDKLLLIRTNNCHAKGQFHFPDIVASVGTS